MAKSQKQKVIDRLLDEGFVDNFWSIETRTSLRLGAIIHSLKADGWVFEGRFGKEEGEHMKNYYYYLKSAPEATLF